MTHSLIVKKVCSRVKKKKREEKEREQFTTLTLFWPRAKIFQSFHLPTCRTMTHLSLVCEILLNIVILDSRNNTNFFIVLHLGCNFFFISTSISLFQSSPQKIYEKNCKSLQWNNRYIFEFTTLIFLILVMILKYRIILSKLLNFLGWKKTKNIVKVFLLTFYEFFTM